MFIKPFYFHRQFNNKYRIQKGLPIGLSIKIQPETGFTEVIGVSVTRCSPRDQFCKKTAREELESKEVELIETKKLPYFIADQMNKAIGGTHYDWQDYAYLYKYVI